jgi:hypothetical protein
MGGLLEAGGNVIGGVIDADNAKDRKKEAMRDYWARLDAMNLEPYQVSKQAPAYQQTKSPVARAYLESFLTGNNADAIQGTRLGATDQKATTQRNFDQAYGGWDKLQKQQNAELADNTRFQPKSIDYGENPIRKEKEEAYVKNPNVAKLESLLGRKLTPAEANAAANAIMKGFGADEDDGQFFMVYERPSGKNRGATTINSKENAEEWLKNYMRAGER